MRIKKHWRAAAAIPWAAHHTGHASSHGEPCFPVETKHVKAQARKFHLKLDLHILWATLNWAKRDGDKRKHIKGKGEADFQSCREDNFSWCPAPAPLYHRGAPAEAIYHIPLALPSPAHEIQAASAWMHMPASAFSGTFLRASTFGWVYKRLYSSWNSRNVHIDNCSQCDINQTNRAKEIVADSNYSNQC